MLVPLLTATAWGAPSHRAAGRLEALDHRALGEHSGAEHLENQCLLLRAAPHVSDWDHGSISRPTCTITDLRQLLEPRRHLPTRSSSLRGSEISGHPIVASAPVNSRRTSAGGAALEVVVRAIELFARSAPMIVLLDDVDG